MSYITFEDFKKVEIKVGKILSVEEVENADKLLKLTVDFGISKIINKNENGEEIIEERKDIRQIISGIKEFFPDITKLVNKKTMFVTNLEHRKIRGLVSEGMIFALSSLDEKEGNLKFSLISPENDIEEGTIAR